MRFSVALALVAVALMAVPVAAQSPELGDLEVTAKVKVTPNRAGTPRNPQPVKVTVDGELIPENGYERPIVKSGRVLIGKGGVWNGAKHPKCSQAVLAREGVKACPKGSIFGKGYATGYADTVRTKPTITIVNGGERRVYAYTVLTNPALVEEPVEVRIKKRTGKWAYQLDVDVPESLQVVAGVPISLTQLHIEVGKGDYLVSTHCPADGRWRYRATSELVDGRHTDYSGSTPCKQPR